MKTEETLHQINRLIKRSKEIIRLRLILRTLKRIKYTMSFLIININTKDLIDKIIDEIKTKETELMYWNSKDLFQILSSNSLSRSIGVEVPSKFWLTTTDLKKGYVIIDGIKDSVALILSPKDDTFLVFKGDIIKSNNIHIYEKELKNSLTPSDISFINFSNLMFKRGKNEKR